MAEQATATQTDETDIEGISFEDALKAIEVVKEALSFRSFIKEGIFGQKFMELAPEERMQEFLNPRISIFFPDEEKNVPSIFMRITGDEGPLVEAFFYPIEAAWSFLDEGRGYVARIRPEDWTDDQAEEQAKYFAVQMMLMMIDNLYNRSKLMMDSFTMETIAQWQANEDENVHEYYAAKGENQPKPKKTYLDGMLRLYNKDVKQLWKYQGQTFDNWRKIRLVEEYEILYKHWRRLYKMVSCEDADWREYAKAGSFSDTPDELLSKLDNVNRSSEETISERVSEIALEHSARRVGLMKKSGIDAWAQQKRKEGILVSDYSGAQLFTFLKEGKELQQRVEQNKKIQEQIATYPSAEVKPNPALVKKQKSFKRKLDYVKEKSERQFDSKTDSAIGKKT